MNRNLSLLVITIVATIPGCGGGSSRSAPPPPPVSVALSTMPPAWLGTGGTASVAATVQNDPAAAGVTWSCTPATACGAFSPTSTPSGSTTTFTAPGAVPNGGSVTVVATSVTDSSKSASAVVVISGTGSNATLKGQYAFLIMAPTGNATTKGTTTFAGSVNLDGNGNILGGVEDIVSTIYRDQDDPILATSPSTASSYSVDSSGHGKMIFQTQHGETLSFSFVLTSGSHAVVIETGGDPGSGTLDLQSGNFSTSQISGSYSFTMDGVDTAVPPVAKVAFGGVFSSDGQGNITGGTLDTNIGGTVTSQAFTGTINITPDTNGRGEFTVVPLPGTTRTFAFYIVSSKVLRLFESDNVDLTGGSAYAQGAAMATLSGNFVFEHSGWTSTGRAVTAGQLRANGMSSITSGVSDANLGGAAPTTPAVAKPVTGTFAFPSGLEGTLNLTDAAGSSTFNVYMVDPSLNLLDPDSATGGGALLLHTDANIIGTGRLIPQTSSTLAPIVGNQGLNLQNCVAASTTNELDLVGVVTSDGSGNLTNGASDYDQSNSPNSAGPFTGTLTADSGNPGHFTGSLNIPTPSGGYPFIPPSVTALNASFYAVSGTQLLVIQTDNTANISGYLFQQRLP